MRTAIKYFPFIFLLGLIISCSARINKQTTNDILQSIMKSHEKDDVLYYKTVENLRFSIPISKEVLDGYYYGKRFNTDLDSLVTEMDIKAWNNKLENYQPLEWNKEEINGLKTINKMPSYTERKNDSTLDTLGRILILSTPFLNKESDKALVYVKNYYSEAKASGYVMILFKTEQGFWEVVYTGTIWTA